MYADAGGLGLPFVPFTFPTVLFCRLAANFGYSLSWGDADRAWSAYSAGVESGAIRVQPDGSVLPNAVVDHLTAKGISLTVARQWVGTAQAAALEWWGQGSYFARFGGAAGVLGAAGGVVQGAVEGARAIGDTIVSSVSRALGVPRFLLWIVMALILAVVVWLAVKMYFPRAKLIA